MFDFLKNSKQTQYFLTTESDLHGKFEVEDLLTVQSIDRATAKRMQYADTCLKCIYKKGKISSLTEFDELNNENIAIPDSLKNLEFKDYPKHEISFLVDEKGEYQSFLGGKAPDNFVSPTSEYIASPFQFLGKLNREELKLNWFPFEDLFLTYPLFTSITNFLFIDYGNPFAPEVIKADQINIEYPFGEIPFVGEHVYEQKLIGFKPLADVPTDELSFDYWRLGVAGVPSWVQYPKLPYCPISNKPMKFVCQIDCFDRIATETSDLQSTSKHFSNASKYMNFWGDGVLYIFIQPETKVVAYFIQNS
ncbi:MAG: hypothetical protein AAGJ93_00920 [Bacteroidota bacterium]